MCKVWHLICRHEHVRWSCCVETFLLLIPLWPTEVYTPPDYMSVLVSLAKQAPGCRRGVPEVASYTCPCTLSGGQGSAFNQLDWE